MRLLFIFLSLGYSIILGGQDLEILADTYARKHFDLFRELLSIPNDAHFPDQVEKNVVWCEGAFEKRGFKTIRLTTDGPPLLLADRMTSKTDTKTVLFYLQIDGQPVDSQYWFQADPYTPALKMEAVDGGWDEIPWERIHGDYDREWRVYARSASDAKGPASMFLAAIDAIDDLRREPDFNMKVILDFEEERGSPHLPDAVSKYSDALEADMLVIFDGPMHITNEPTLTFGARGISKITLTVYGPVFPQHSGHYGNYCPNPAVRLSQLIASMKDDYGVVTIPGYYDGIILNNETMEILEAVPDDERLIKARLGIKNADRVAPTLQQSLQYPSLNVRGLSSGWVGTEARTIIPSTATAEIDMRLVKEVDPDRLIGLVRRHIEDQGYYLVSGKPTRQERVLYDRICRFNASTSYLAFRTDFDSDIGKWLTSAMTNTFGSKPIRHRTSGGSIPISPFVTTLNIPAVTVPTVNRDNNQHSPNENLRLGNYVDGIKTIIGILMEPLGVGE